MEMRIQGSLGEVGDQLLTTMDEACDALDEVARLKAENTALRAAAIKVVDEFRLRGEAAYSPLAHVINGLDDMLVHGRPRLELVQDGGTLGSESVAPAAWPPVVGTRVTYVDNGERWTDCIVREHCGDSVRLDNGDGLFDDGFLNGGTLAVVAKRSQVEVPCG